MNTLFGAFIVTLCLIFSGQAWGEQADSAQPTKITSNQMKYDDVNQINTFIGNVRMTRGTLIMRGEKMIMRQDPAGNQHGTMYGREGELASFRQKRDGGPDLWVEGYAERMEYDSNTEVSKLFYHAKLLRLNGKKIIDEVNGNFISYDSKTETYTVSNVVEGDPKTKGERIKIILPPREETKPRKDTRIISGKAPVGSNSMKEE